MKQALPQKSNPRRFAGQASLVWIVLIVLFALALSAVIYLALNLGEEGGDTSPQATQEQIDEELGKLQQSLQTAMQEKQDLTRLAAQARAFTEEHPEQQGGYVLLAQARMGLYQWEQAYIAWQRALSFDASAFELNKMAGNCAAKLGDIEQAREHYQQAIASTNDQADSEVYAALGHLYISTNDADKAEQHFKRAVDARGPGEDTNYKHEAYAGLANVAALRQQFDQALSWIDRAIKMANLDSDADSAGYHIQKAHIYMVADRDEDAVTMLNYTWSQFADSPWRIESARLRAKLYERAGQIDTAVDYLQSIAEWHRLAEQRNNETIANFTALLADWQIKANRRDAANISLHNLQILMPSHPAIAELKAKLR